MNNERDDLRIVALDYAWRTANQIAGKESYTKDDVLRIARDYLAFLQDKEKLAA